MCPGKRLSSKAKDTCLLLRSLELKPQEYHREPKKSEPEHAMSYKSKPCKMPGLMRSSFSVISFHTRSCTSFASAAAAIPPLSAIAQLLKYFP